MSGKKITVEVCGRCFKRFTSLDWADPADANRVHQQTCPPRPVKQ